MRLLTQDQKVQTLRYLFISGILATLLAVVAPSPFQTDLLTTGILTLTVSFMGWFLVDDPTPVPFLWWLLGWRVDSVEELSDFKITMYYRWLKFKNTEKLVFFRKYTSREIAGALESCESEIDERSSLVLQS